MLYRNSDAGIVVNLMLAVSGNDYNDKGWLGIGSNMKWYLTTLKFSFLNRTRNKPNSFFVGFEFYISCTTPKNLNLSSIPYIFDNIWVVHKIWSIYLGSIFLLRDELSVFEKFLEHVRLLEYVESVLFQIAGWLYLKYIGQYWIFCEIYLTRYLYIYTKIFTSYVFSEVSFSKYKKLNIFGSFFQKNKQFPKKKKSL